MTNNTFFYTRLGANQRLRSTPVFVGAESVYSYIALQTRVLGHIIHLAVEVVSCYWN